MWKLACEFAVSLDAHQFRIVVHELLQHAATRGLVVGIDDVAKRHGLGAVDLTDPVAVGQVDADGRAGRGVAGLTSHVHHVVGDAHHLGLLVRIHEWHVILKPLGAVHERGHAGAGVEVFDFDDGLVAAGVPERVVVDLHKAVDVVHIAFGVLDPVDVVKLHFSRSPVS